jgi:hypothetical protein
MQMFNVPRQNRNLTHGPGYYLEMNVMSADHGQSVFTYNLSNEINWPSTDTETPTELKADFFYANAMNPS